MKKLYIMCLSIIFLITFQSTPISALKSKKSGIQTSNYSDGSYLEITYKKYKQPFKSLKNSRKKAIIKSGSKKAIYKNRYGHTLWSITVNGRFKYTEKKVYSCTKSSIYTSCPSKSWRIVKQASYKSGNAATGTVTAKKYSNKHFVIHTIKKVLSLRCSPSGQLY